MATSSFTDTFYFATQEEQKRFFDDLHKAEINPPEKVHSNIQYTKELTDKTLDLLRERFNL